MGHLSHEAVRAHKPAKRYLLLPLGGLDQWFSIDLPLGAHMQFSMLCGLYPHAIYIIPVWPRGCHCVLIRLQAVRGLRTTDLDL